MALYIGNGNVTPIKVEEDSGVDSLNITPLKEHKLLLLQELTLVLNLLLYQV